MATPLRIRRAAVLGAGTMGGALAAHLANAGLPTRLLDLTPELARAGLQRALKSKPAAFYTPDHAKLVTPGSFEADLDQLAEADWVVEAVVENLEVKQKLLGQVAPHLHPQAVVTTNTSGMSIAGLAEALPPSVRPRFLGTHFFNPPRYLHLLELIPGPATDPAVVEGLAAFGERVLGKGVVVAKDRPGFIANRLGLFTFLHTLHLMVEGGYTVAEVDRLTGPVVGRPRTATFRTADMVGLDILVHVARHLYASLPQDPWRDLLRPPAFLEELVQRGWLGAKAGKGFYQKVKQGGQTTILMLDYETLEYVPRPQAALPSLELARNVEGLGRRLKLLLKSRDRAGSFIWQSLAATLAYGGACLMEVADSIPAVDRALRWGYGWERGPFQVWDLLGVRRSCQRMEAEGHKVPPVARALLEAGGDRFYDFKEGAPHPFDFKSRRHAPLPARSRVLSLARLKAQGKALLEGPDATLVDLGEGVACLEFQTLHNTLGPGLFDMLERSLNQVEAEGWRGLVISNEAEHFSVGANLALLLAELADDNQEEVELMVARFQKLNQRLRYSPVPVVAAVRGRVLGGGCEVLLHADRVCAAAESYIGLVEVGAGLIPAGGGCKELVRRLNAALPPGVEVDLGSYVRGLLEIVGMARVATSGPEARQLGYLRPCDPIILNLDHLLYQAKQAVVRLDEQGYRPPLPCQLKVAGREGLAGLQTGLYNLAEGGYITAYDRVVAGKLARVLCGGEVAANTKVSEDYLLDLERQAFMELCADPRTRARMQHLLTTGKPLRN